MTLESTTNLTLANGTSLSGYVAATYDQLVETFGEPHKGDGYKVDAGWVLTANDGHVITIYNYKNGKNYEGENGLDVEDMIEWHVGGFRQQEDVDLVVNALRA